MLPNRANEQLGVQGDGDASRIAQPLPMRIRSKIECAEKSGFVRIFLLLPSRSCATLATPGQPLTNIAKTGAAGWFLGTDVPFRAAADSRFATAAKPVLFN